MLLPLFLTLFAAPADTAKQLDSIPAAKLASVAPASVSSDLVSSYDRFGKWQFGFAGGSSTGGGLAVRRWFDERNGLELHGYAYLSKKHYPEDGDSWGGNTSKDGHYYGRDTGTVASGELLLGVQYLHEVVRVHLFTANGAIKGPSHLRGLTFVGIGGYASYEDQSLRSSRTETTGYYPYSYTQVPYQIESHSSTQELLGGAGGGAELELSRFSVHLLVGMGGYYRFDPSEYKLGPTVDGGIFIRF